jgi:hypothetical protein
MKAFRLSIFAAVLAASAFGAPDPGVLLSAGDVTGEWKPLIAALAGAAPIQATFTERRFFPFRSEPTLLQGILRISPEHGLSLQYTHPEANVMIADAAGLVLREPGGRSREMPSGSREAGAIASLLPIMRFDLQALLPRFAVRAWRTGTNWRFEFTPRDPGAARALGSVIIDGSGTGVQHLQFRRSASQRVEIEVGTTLTGVTFTPADLKLFFR